MIQVEVTSSSNKAPAGLYQGVCAEVVDLGFSQKTYKQDSGVDEVKSVHEIQYIFQLNKMDTETGKRFTVRSRPFNLILAERSSLRAFLLQWRGHDLTDAEQKPPGVDVDLVNRNAMVSVVHANVGDKTYANIGSITPLMEGMPEIAVENYEPQGEAILAARAKAANGGTAPAAPAAIVGDQAAAPSAVPGTNDDIPF